MKIQAYLTAATTTLKRLAVFIAAPLWALVVIHLDLVPSEAWKSRSSIGNARV